ncbi:MAG: serine hydrolase domain-containing protein [Acidimicrobiales bacterium]
MLTTVRGLQAQYSLNSVIFGVWANGVPVVTGAIGTALPGVPATREDHFRIGNTTESLETTLLLQLVDRGKIRLDDPLSKWYPSLPEASKITVAMLASSTSGYFHYVNDENFIDAVHADPFRLWSPSELVAVGTSPTHPLNFPPGTSWSFSDTNFVLLGEILGKVGGEPVSAQLQKMILGPLGLDNTQMTTAADTPSPVLHGYTGERGVWEDDTFWSPSWATYTGNMTSDLSDMGRWAKTVGTGVLLSAKSRARQFAPDTVGLGHLTSTFYYGLGGAVANGWILGGAPGLEGYTGLVSYLPAKKLAVVIFTTSTPQSPAGVQYAPAIFNRVGAQLAPSSPPNFPAG